MAITSWGGWHKKGVKVWRPQPIRSVATQSAFDPELINNE
jgi:hypothetical protein